MGIEPTTSAVLKPRHNQLDHPCDEFSKKHALTLPHNILGLTK